MPTENDPSLKFQNGWAFRIIPSANGQPAQNVVVYIHGWTGDENSMDIFRKDLPATFLALFPRGPVAAPSGYGWTQARQDSWPPMANFEQPCRDLMREIELRLSELGVPDLPLRLVGFSQGGAVCHTLTVLFPRRIERTAVLAGFLPQMDPGIDLSYLAGKAYFIAHGRRDETISIELAYESVKRLRAAGAQVELCESNSGHKLGLECLKKLTSFITT